MFIRSERLFLRPGWPEDGEELEALIADAAVTRQLTAAPPDDDGHRQGNCASEWLGPSREPLLPRFCITVPSARGAKLVGGIGLRRDRGEVSLACWIGRPFWGQGYASEAARAVLSLARALGHRRIVAEHFADDLASARFLAGLGFKPNGEPRARLSWARGGEALAMTHALGAQAGPGRRQRSGRRRSLDAGGVARIGIGWILLHPPALGFSTRCSFLAPGAQAKEKCGPSTGSGRKIPGGWLQPCPASPTASESPARLRRLQPAGEQRGIDILDAQMIDGAA